MSCSSLRKNVLIISERLVDVPIIKPATPISTSIAFLIIIHVFSNPVRVYQNVQHSIIAGKAKPNDDRQSAPNRDMNSSRFGMATASKTAK